MKDKKFSSPCRYCISIHFKAQKRRMMGRLASALKPKFEYTVFYQQVQKKTNVGFLRWYKTLN